jgi:mRNA-degrading endonuclease RelE of RelBE toxin-antitoxin system
LLISSGKIQQVRSQIYIVVWSSSTIDLSGFFKLRIGDYRVIYEFDREEKVIFIDRIALRIMVRTFLNLETHIQSTIPYFLFPIP